MEDLIEFSMSYRQRSPQKTREGLEDLVNGKGWHGIACGMTTAFVEGKARLGARYIVGQKELFTSEGCVSVLHSLMITYPVVSNTDWYFILKTGR